MFCADRFRSITRTVLPSIPRQSQRPFQRSAINDVFKDSDNLLWIATWDGLNMHAWRRIPCFQLWKENDPRSIGNNVIKHIAEDKREEYLDQHH